MVLLSNQHHLLIVQAKKSAKSSHEYMITSIKNKIVYERTKRKIVIFTRDELIALIEERSVLNDVNEDNNSDKLALMHLSIYQGNMNILNPAKVNKELVNKISAGMKDNVYYVEIVQEGQETDMLVASLVTLEQNQYIIVTDYDVSDIYSMYNQQVHLIKQVSIYSGFLIATILLFLIRYLLSPLQEINAGTRKIAKGEYGARVYVKGGDEFTQLSQNMNKMAESIEKNINSLEEVAQNRKTFIDNLSHELKTPLTSILGFADILRIKRKVTDEERQEYAGIIVTEANRMKTLSGKLMEMISLENTQLERKEHSLMAILNEVMAVFATIGKQNKIESVINVKDAIIDVDQELFKSLIYNLLDNAMKASKPGDLIRIEADIAEAELQLKVVDQGIGISKEELDKITEPFYMVDKSRSRKFGGAGLGLALCNEIAEVHGARLSFHSELGIGTTVVIHMKGGLYREIV